MPIERQRSLDELDPPEWGEPEYESYLVTTCHRLRKKPLGEFTVEDLRIMVGQNIGLSWLVPLALDVLENVPLAEGNFFPGDLLKNVLCSEESFWKANSEQVRRTLGVLDRVDFEILDEDDDLVRNAIDAFRQRWGEPSTPQS